MEQVARRIESLGVGECMKLAKYLRTRVPGLVLAQKSVLPPLEALAEQWSMPAVSLGCICWYWVKALNKRPHRALTSRDTSTPSTLCLGTEPLGCVKMNHRNLIGAGHDRTVCIQP